MYEKFNMFGWLEYDGVEYLTRQITYTDRSGDEHSCLIADEKLSDVLMNDNGWVSDEAEDIDSDVYCYAEISALLIKDDQALAQWLEENVTEMELE